MNNILTYKIDTEQPIDIKELAESLIAIQNMYRKSIISNEASIKISEVRKGSYEFDIVVLGLGLTLPYIENFNSAIDFIKNLKNCYSFFKDNKFDNNTNQINIDDAKNTSKIIQPIISIGNNSTVIIQNGYSDSECFSVISKEAAEVQKIYSYIENKERKTKEELQTYKYFQNILVEFTQTRTDDKRGNKLLCKNIYNKELNVEFSSDYLKKQILEEHNPHLHLYNVDLQVIYENNVPKIYKIISIKDIKNKNI
ncbi:MULTISPECIES: hypothetical protein [Campylobacter]|uniref:hypothetical protein n=1 Tax=Campylobacter TaxID=194 RepID=UPI00069BD3DE|nr:MULTISPECIES: hypothetical protein [Campylobacter]EAL5442197.1 hypothetical protein [Campylobacter jejuni]EDO6827510.1 hypothetical protein [Campylobacter coli]EDO6927804.1 hypothetical protein [Campylobacter coli]KQI09850.1 hypothetical protein Y786_06875 [Campylobacter coli CVM 41971]MBZ8204992.1 hypothetical protein [Campylobacter coli]